MGNIIRLNLRKLPINDLIRFIEYLIRQYRYVDAYWFLNIEKLYGLHVASKINEEVWEIIGERCAKDIMKTFNIKEGNPLHVIIKALSYFPWFFIETWEILDLTNNKAIIACSSCPPQEARLRRGLGIFPCKNMHYRLFMSFVKVFNDKINVKCYYAPPDNSEKINVYWCKWEFSYKS